MKKIYSKSIYRLFVFLVLFSIFCTPDINIGADRALGCVCDFVGFLLVRAVQRKRLDLSTPTSIEIWLMAGLKLSTLWPNGQRTGQYRVRLGERCGSAYRYDIFFFFFSSSSFFHCSYFFGRLSCQLLSARIVLQSFLVFFRFMIY